MSRFTSFASILILSSTLAAGCDDDEPAPPVTPPPPASGLEFKKLDAAEREAVVQSAMGVGVAAGFFAAFQASFEAEEEGSTCPTITDKGSVIEIDAGAGCTSASGTAYKGKVEIENMPFFFPEEELDNAKPMQMRFIGFAVDEQTLDGSWWQSTPAPEAPYTSKLDLTQSVPDLAIHVTLNASCNAGGCTSTEGSAGELIGKGKFNISIDSENNAEGDLVGGRVELAGKDKLTMDLGKQDANGCATYQIDGADAGQICDEDDSEE